MSLSAESNIMNTMQVKNTFMHIPDAPCQTRPKRSMSNPPASKSLCWDAETPTTTHGEEAGELSTQSHWCVQGRSQRMSWADMEEDPRDNSGDNDAVDVPMSPTLDPAIAHLATPCSDRAVSPCRLSPCRHEQLERLAMAAAGPDEATPAGFTLSLLEALHSLPGAHRCDSGATTSVENSPPQGGVLEPPPGKHFLTTSPVQNMSPMENNVAAAWTGFLASSPMAAAVPAGAVPPFPFIAAPDASPITVQHMMGWPCAPIHPSPFFPGHPAPHLSEACARGACQPAFAAPSWPSEAAGPERGGPPGRWASRSQEAPTQFAGGAQSLAAGASYPRLLDQASTPANAKQRRQQGRRQQQKEQQQTRAQQKIPSKDRASDQWETDTHAGETESTDGSDTAPGSESFDVVASRSSRRPALAVLSAAGSPEAAVRAGAGERARRQLTSSELAEVFHVASQKVGVTPSRSLTKSRDFVDLLNDLKRKIVGQPLEADESLKLLKAFGKLELQGPDAHWFILHMDGLLDRSVPANWSSQDLSFCLWSLAKMALDGGNRGGSADAARNLAIKVVGSCTPRVQSFKPQCLTMSIHSIAKLRLSGPAVAGFAAGCVEECTRRRDLHTFAPQSLANIVWAAAQLVQSGPSGKGAGVLNDKQAWAIWEAVSDASADRLREFPAQELSMAANATSKLQQRASKAHSHGDLVEKADNFLLEIGRQATARVKEFMPQGISTIALALAKGDALSHQVTCEYLEAAAKNSTSKDSQFSLDKFEPQAISNFCCAVGRVCSEMHQRGAAEGSSSLKVFESLIVSVAEEANARIKRSGIANASRHSGPMQFGWVDISGVLTAFGHVRVVDISGRCNLLALTALRELERGAHEERSITMRVMLNVCLSAARMGAEQRHVGPVVSAMANRIRKHNEKLTPQDKRQWDELKRFCSREQAQ